MPQEIAVSPTSIGELAEHLQAALVRIRPKAVGIASAFVSVWGVQRIKELLRKCGDPQCRLVAGTSYFITHPEAINLAQEAGWGVRLGQIANAIYHPKLLVAGGEFTADGNLEPVSFTYVGSANLTRGGLKINTECGFFAEADADFTGASNSFSHLWNTATIPDAASLRNYASLFAETNRRRSSRELEALGVSDQIAAEPISTNRILTIKPPNRSAVGNNFAVAAWAGLQAFTGGYAFQIEFPKLAGAVLSRLINPATERGRIEVLCTNDNQIREMQFRFYRDNGMFRLNVPNEVPNVLWVREHRDGVALVQRGLAGGAPIRLTILLPGAEMNEIIERSLSLGSWGKTSKRLYGWY